MGTAQLTADRGRATNSLDQETVSTRGTGMLLIFEGLLLLAPLAILGSAIDWPATLDEPASVMLPMILENAGSVMLGYSIYMVYSLLFLPVALLTARVVDDPDSPSLLLQIAIGFGVISALARTVGILRWLVPMPLLASLYQDPSISETARETIEIVYGTLNSYGGAIGEVLGVSLFAGIWLMLLSIVAFRSRRMPRWLAVWGMIGAIALFGSLIELAGIDSGALITINVTIVQFWMLTFGVVLVRRGR